MIGIPMRSSWGTFITLVLTVPSVGCINRSSNEQRADSGQVAMDSRSHLAPDTAVCEPDYLCFPEDREVALEEELREERLRILQCTMDICVVHSPREMCVTISCRPKGSRILFSRDNDYGALKSSLDGIDEHLLTQILVHSDLLHDVLMCMVRMRPTNDDIVRHVWFDIQLHTDGRLSLRSARRLDHAVEEKIDWASRGIPNRRLGLCMEKALVGKMLYNPKCIDPESPRTVFPSVVLQFNGSIAKNPPAMRKKQHSQNRPGTKNPTGKGN